MASRFTTKGWLVLPLALTLRIPLALLTYVFEFISGFFNALGNRTERLMNAMPAPKINPEWREEQRKAAIAKWNASYKD